MVVHIIIGGKLQCEDFAEICLIADYLSQKLPNFCYERIEKFVLEWPQWLCKINLANNWHHVGSPIVWKELQIKGSKPFYIGGAAQFLEYVHSYYNFDLFMGCDKYHGLIRNFGQFKKKLKEESIENTADPSVASEPVQSDTVNRNDYVVCVSGVSCTLGNALISRLLDFTYGHKRTISKIYLYDEDCSEEFLYNVENQCSFISTNYPTRVVKYADKIGNALTAADILIILDHVPFDPNKSIGEWLHANMKLMQNLAIMINASASRAMYIILANVGPACFNATVLMHSVTTNIKNVVVATSDVALEVLDTVSEVCDLPVRKMFCPAVWGFVGINHLVDLKTCVHEYNSFEPYTRYTRVKNSTLNIGRLTPEMRTLEYLTYFDDTIWVKAAEKKKILPPNKVTLNKAVAIVNLIRVWLIESTTTDYIVPLGILCDGSFGLTFDGSFSQPARLFGREWRPAKEYFMPKDQYVKLPYLQYIAEMMMKINRTALPPIIKYTPCKCKRVNYNKKKVWY